MARKKAGQAPGHAVLATNRRASHEFHLLQRFEAGIVLLGPEVKSARAGKVNLREAYARIENGEIHLHGAHFSPYGNARDNPDPLRKRKLLMHAREIRKLAKETASSGTTLVPTRLYLKAGRIKVEIALARGKRAPDKREAIKKRDVERELRRAVGSRRSG